MNKIPKPERKSPATLPSTELSTLEEAVRMTAAELRKAGIGEFAQEARLLVCHAFDIGSVELITKSSMQINLHQMEILDCLTERRKGGEPVARIIGEKEFYGFRFQLSKDTLEPRVDTETLIDVILADMRKCGDEHIKILDIGTGSGAIIISLLCNLPNATGTASDISVDTLDMAKKNAVMNGVDDRILFVKANWCEAIEEKFDVIVSNPPYIKSGIIPGLAREVKEHDPLLALDGGSDGLEAYRNIFTQCSSKLGRMGKLYLEIGYDQREPVCLLANESGWRFVRLVKDIGGNTRVVVFEP